MPGADSPMKPDNAVATNASNKLEAISYGSLSAGRLPRSFIYGEYEI